MRQGPPVGTNNYDLDLGVWPNFLKTITMLRTFELWVLELIHFTWIFVVTKSFHGYQHFTLWPWPLKLTYFQETLTFLINFEQFVIEVWCFINEYYTIYDLPVDTNSFWPYDLYLGAWPTFWKAFSPSKNFWNVSACVYAFHMNISSGNAFPRVPTFCVLCNLVSGVLLIFFKQ